MKVQENCIELTNGHLFEDGTVKNFLDETLGHSVFISNYNDVAFMKLKLVRHFWCIPATGVNLDVYNIP